MSSTKKWQTIANDEADDGDAATKLSCLPTDVMDVPSSNHVGQADPEVRYIMKNTFIEEVRQASAGEHMKRASSEPADFRPTGSEPL